MSFLFGALLNTILDGPVTAADDMTIAQARAWLLARLDAGADCPCCTQMAKIYRRRINGGQAVALIKAWRAAGQDWFHLASLDRSREASKLVHWGLLEHDNRPREDGGQSGWWRITDRGVRWLHNRATVTKYVLLFDDRVQGFEGHQVKIVDALGSKFDYRELMAGI